MQSTFFFLHSWISCNAISCVMSTQRLKWLLASSIFPCRNSSAAFFLEFCRLSRLFSSVLALAGRCRPSNTKIGLIPLDISIFTYLRQYWMWLKKNGNLAKKKYFMNENIENSHIGLFASSQLVGTGKCALVQPAIGIDGHTLSFSLSNVKLGTGLFQKWN